MPAHRTICILTDERIHAITLSGGRRPAIVRRADAAVTLPDSLLIEHDAEALADAIASAVHSGAATSSSTPETEVATSTTVPGAVEKITLVVPLNWCFVQSIDIAGKRPMPQALNYKLEEYLPLPLEELTTTFVAEENGRYLGVAVPTQPMSELIEALAARAVQVDSLKVDILVGTNSISGTSDRTSTVVLDRCWGRVYACGNADRAPITATFDVADTPRPVDSLNNTLQRKAIDGEPEKSRWLVLDLASHTTEPELVTSLGSSIQYVAGDDAAVALAKMAADNGNGLDLCRGGWANRQRWQRPQRLVTQCLGLVLVLLLIWVAGTHLRTRNLRDQVTQLRTAQQDLYRQVFDTAKLPPGAALRLASERVRLEGLTRSGGAPAGGSSETGTTCPLDDLRNVVAGLPKEVRIMLQSARLDGRQLNLRGQTAEHRDAERVAESVGKIPNLTARPPRTSRLGSGGVEFSIVATRESADGATN